MARSKKNWNDMTLRKLKTEDKPYEQGFNGMRGLHVRVFPTGQKTVRFVYLEDGKRYRLVLGDYTGKNFAELDGEYTLAKAERVKKVNIVEERKTAKIEEENRQRAAVLEQEAQDNRMTFNKLADLYIDLYASKNKKSWRTDQRILDRNILPTFGSRSVEDVKRHEFTEHLADLAKDAPVGANRTLACLRKMLNWAVDAGYIENNNAARIPAPGGKEASKDRALSKSEIKQFWKLCDKIQNPLHCAILRLVLLTGQRPSEVSQANWSEFKGTWWTIPADRSKNGRENRVYLIPQAKEIIDSIPRDVDCLFPQLRGGKVLNKPVSPSTPPHVLIDAIRADGKMDHFTVHDLRRTFATTLGDLGYMDDQIGLVLNHVRAGVTQRYNRSSHDKPKKEMMMTFSLKFDEILHGKKKPNVVSIA